MAEKSIIIIGAGLAGLSAGCYAQINGYRSEIFEHHTKPGGVASVWKRNGYIIDGGIHFLMGYKPGKATYELYRELGITEANHILNITTYCRFIDETRERSVDITQNLDHVAKDLKSFSPLDTHIIDDLVACARAMKGFDIGTGLSKEPGLQSYLDKIKQMWKMRRLFKYFGKFNKPVFEYVKQIHEPWLQWIIKNLFLAEVPVWFVSMILGLIEDEQVGLLKNGSHDFVSSIERRYNELGGHVTYGATVEEIIVENDRAVGVILADGSKHQADIVISAADGYSTIFKIIGGRYIDKKIKNRFNNWKLFRPLIMVNFGINREFSGEPWMNVIKLEQPVTAANETIDTIALRIFNYSTVFAPPGKTAIQVIFETEWDFWNELQKDRLRYENEKNRIATEVLQRLENHYSGISSQVEMTDIATPYTTWRYTLNHRGSYEGWLPTPEIIHAHVGKTLPGLENFYMAGQWVMPGGGVLPCLYSGSHVIQLICRRDKKRFQKISYAG